MRISFAVSMLAGVALSLGACVSPCFAQFDSSSTFVISDGSPMSGHHIVVPRSSVPRPGHLNTNYVIVDPESWNPAQPPPGAETPASLACVYKLVQQIKGCPIGSSKKVPTGGVGAIAIVDAGDYPTAKQDLHAFSSYFGIPDGDFQVVYADGKKPPVYSDWEVEESLDIEWAHAMAPKAKLFLVESVLCNVQNKCATDPTWQAVKVASNLVAQNGGGVISMSWGDAEWSTEVKYDHYMTTPKVVYFAASGDGGIGSTSHPGASPNVVSVGGTFLNRDNNGNFTSEMYYGGTGNLSPYEPRPSYQDGIKGIVGSHRGYPDVGSAFCSAAIYGSEFGGWGSVCGTSWSSPTMAGIVDAAGSLKKSTSDELTMIYGEYANKQEYKAEFFDITQGNSSCKVGWDICDGVGSVRTYTGK